MLKRLNKKLMLLIMSLTVATTVVACGKSEKTDGEKIDSSNGTKQEISIKAYDQDKNEITLSFKESPKRAITLNQSPTEMMLGLGLGDKMVGTAYLDDEILPQYKEAYDKIPVLSKTYASLEAVLEKNPDILIGWPSNFDEKHLGTVTELQSKGMKVYIPKSTLKGEKKIEDVYEDILNLSKIFEAEENGQKLVGEMKDKIGKVQEKIKGKEPLKVAVIDSIADTKSLATCGNLTLEDKLITLAGGKNIFGDIDKSYTDVSFEELIARNPDVLVVNYFMGSNLSVDKIKNNPMLKDLDAVKNDRIVLVPLTEMMGGVRNADGVERLAKGFYPEIFK
ncbi:ABC transporter substrate-binding protein [uncultured Clostridium sp.]|uniref:ABC transporter substrate-binding protein n=1 Tax=uncultured Clostridium sp. TaxID=59620 RepID=UPI0028E80756|nr:ABC transporter substrate-binding protein [uncultured Clostridium sp.]